MVGSSAPSSGGEAVGATGGPVSAPSLLYEHPRTKVRRADLETLADLHLDQLVAALENGLSGELSESFVHTALGDAAAVRYRQAVVADLDDRRLLEGVRSFVEELRRVRSLLDTSAKVFQRWFRQGWILDAVELYCGAVKAFTECLRDPVPRSAALLGVARYLESYVASETFEELDAGVRSLRSGLTEVSYTVLVRGNRVTVARYEGESDYSEEIEETFAKFSQGADKHYLARFPPREMNHVQARVLENVAKLYPEVFSALDTFCTAHGERFVDETLWRVEGEARCYLGYLEYIAELAHSGMPFCLPEVTEDPDEVSADDAFDLVLAKARAQEGLEVVTNGFSLSGPERILVVTGPNQGGKTTFARMVGQLHHLGALGLPVPCRRASLVLPDRVMSHFERQENLENLRGKLEDELFRAHAIVSTATRRSVVIMNETFSSTTLEDARTLGTEMLRRMVAAGVLGVYVTFVDQLSTFGPATVSMVAAVEPDNPTLRTFKIDRRAADGLAYAGALARSYGLTYEALAARLGG